MKKDKKWLKGLINEEGIFMDMHLLGRIDKQYWKNENIKINKGRLFYLIDQLDEPEKVVIPQFVADWIDTHNLHGNNPLREYIDLESDFTEGWTNEEDASVYHWINKDKNPYAFIDALRYGYEVEKEKKWVVKQGKLYLKSFDIWREECNNAEFVFDKESTIKFTDKVKAEAVALLVDGTVEEVTE